MEVFGQHVPQKRWVQSSLRAALLIFSTVLSPTSKNQYLMESIPKFTEVDFFLTYKCNCKCSYCFIQDSGSDIVMAPDLLDESIDWIVRHGGSNIYLSFFGGEPTLEPDLIERAVQRCRSWEKRHPVLFSFGMTTNALSIDEKLAAKLAEWGVHYLVSIDGYGERHNMSRPARFTEDPFEIIRSRFSLFKQYQQHITARLTVLPSLVKGLCDDLIKLQQMGFDSFIIAPAFGMHWSLEKSQQYVEELVRFASGRAIKNGHPVPKMTPIDSPVQGNRTWGCAAGRQRISIDPRGKIFACARMTRLDEEDGLSFGDIFKGIDPEGNITRFQDTTYESRLECIDCLMREKCIGGCPAANWKANQSVVKPDQDQCRMTHALEKIKQQVYSNQTTMSA
ncbi:MAG: radical SAM protein [Candidatus Electrothrix sp. ATG1]|nr:radical SAM protein [Candidatus Electrothrix sp. ATG1]MCI5208725.1 radical SAM protein [Candidatus Electrothrix sp. ATG2]